MATCKDRPDGRSYGRLYDVYEDLSRGNSVYACGERHCIRIMSQRAGGTFTLKDVDSKQEFALSTEAPDTAIVVAERWADKGIKPINNSPLARATVKTLRVLSAQFLDFADRIEEHPHAIPDESILHWWEAMAYNLTATIKQIRYDLKG